MNPEELPQNAQAPAGAKRKATGEAQPMVTDDEVVDVQRTNIDPGLTQRVGQQPFRMTVGMALDQCSNIIANLPTRAERETLVAALASAHGMVARRVTLLSTDAVAAQRAAETKKEPKAPKGSKQKAGKKDEKEPAGKSKTTSADAGPSTSGRGEPTGERPKAKYPRLSGLIGLVALYNRAIAAKSKVLGGQRLPADDPYIRKRTELLSCIAVAKAAEDAGKPVATSSIEDGISNFKSFLSGPPGRGPG